MKQMILEEFKRLKHGDIVHKIYGYKCRSLTFVGIHPNNDNYIIFCDGEYTESLYLFKGLEGWYIGEYDEKFIGNILTKIFKREIKSIKKIYLKKEEK